MTLQRYAAYKASGIAWLGCIPEHWPMCPLKRNLDFLTSGSRGWAEHYSEGGPLFIRIGNLTRETIHLDLSDIQRVNVPAGAEGERTRVQPGDVLFSITAYLGSVAVVPDGFEPAYVSQHVALARLRRDCVLPAWVAYVASSRIGKTYLEAQGYGGSKVQLSLEDVASLILPMPPLPEQFAICAFLARELSKIDALIAEQEKLIALLAEKRQATISHAVARGLNRDAPMMDSGVAWLGEVPAHWAVGALGYLASIETGSTPDRAQPSYWNGSIPWVKTGEICWAPIHETEEFISDDAIANSAVKLARPGTLMMAMYGQGVTRGRVAVLAITATYNQACAAISFGPRISVEFGRYFFMAAYDHVRDGGNETSQMNLSAGIIAKIKVPVPPADEQAAISKFLDDETAKVDRLRAQAIRAIALLKERRSALITAAVTGHIDVRGQVRAPAAEPALAST